MICDQQPANPPGRYIHYQNGSVRLTTWLTLYLRRQLICGYLYQSSAGRFCSAIHGPILIIDKARYIKSSLTRIIHEVCSSVSEDHKAGRHSSSHHHHNRSMSKFSTSAYFFVSAHVARAFPDLLESRIVLMNHSFSLSKD
jgi:hypothetical protein